MLVHEVHHLTDVPVLVVITGLEVCVVGVLELKHIGFVVLVLLGVVEVAEVAGAVALRTLWNNGDRSVERCNEFLNLLERLNAVKKQDSMPMRFLRRAVFIYI